MLGGRNISARARAVWLGGLALAVLALSLVVLAGRDDDAALDTEGTTTTEPATTATEEEEEETTTSTSTSTSTTTTTTTIPPTTTLATTTTAPPPPPPEVFDASAVIAFAKANVGGSPPQTYTGAKTCPASATPPSDAGDDTVRDISDWYLTRYCDGVYRGVLATSSDTPLLDAAWFEVDANAGGCAGIDHMVVGWHGSGAQGLGVVIAVPSCDQSTWRRTDAAGFPVYNGAWLQLDFREAAIGSPASFTYRGAVRGQGDPVVDRVPNSGPGRFTR